MPNKKKRYIDNGGGEDVVYRASKNAPEVKVFAKGDPRKNNDYYKAHSKQRAEFQRRVANRENQDWVQNTMVGLGMLPIGTSAAITAPMLTLASIAGGTAVDKSVEGVSKGKYNSIGALIEDKTGVPEVLGEFANPGYWIGGAGFKRFQKSNLGRSLEISKQLSDNIRRATINKPIAIGDEAITNNVIGTINTKQTQSVPTLSDALGSADFYSNLQSKNKTLALPRYSSLSNKEFLQKANNYFYNYEPIPITDDIIANTELTEQLVKNRIAEHNTFYRGVRNPLYERRENTRHAGKELYKKLKEEGIPITRENVLKYVATHYAGNTGHGRAGMTDFGLGNRGTIYTSNSLRTAAGYASSNTHNGKKAIPVGEIAIVRRPYTLGSDRNKWFEEGDFFLYPNDAKITSHKLLENIQRQLENTHTDSKDEIINYIKRYKADNINKGTKEELSTARKQYFNEKYKKYLDAVNDINQQLDKSLVDMSNYVISPKLKPTPKQMIFAENLRDFMRLKDNIDPYELVRLSSKYKQGFRKMKKNEPTRDENGDLLDDIVRKWEVRVNPSSIKVLSKQAKVQPYQIRRYNYELHKQLNKVPSNKFAFTTEGIYGTDKTTSNYQHYIFTGPVGEQGLEFVDFLPKEKWKPYIKEATRYHIGRGNKGASKKTFSSGGSIYIKPSHRGRFTALKERTGHSATWFKENGTPAQKKMATFALNAAKWKH